MKNFLEVLNKIKLGKLVYLAIGVKEIFGAKLTDMDVTIDGETKQYKNVFFIATMNQGYAGTRDLNEALASRFVVIMMPEISSDGLIRLIRTEFPGLKMSFATDLARIFMDIQKKTVSSEISGRLLDLRGMLDAVALMEKGIEPWTALDMGITNKSPDEFERSLLQDIIRGRLPQGLDSNSLFNPASS